MDLPSTHEDRLYDHLVMFKGFLSAVCHCRQNTLTEIWVMKDYGVVESWTKSYKIGAPWGIVRTLCFWTEEEDALLM